MSESLSGNGSKLSDAQEIAETLHGISGTQSIVIEEEMSRAAGLLYEMLTSPQPAEVVKDRLEEINELVPALLELNIRQARLDGKLELAEGLQNLFVNIFLQLQENLHVEDLFAGMVTSGRRATIAETRVLFLAPRSLMDAPRYVLPATALATLGCDAVLESEMPSSQINAFDVIVAHNPHADPNLMARLAGFATLSVPIIVDLDAEFDKMPLTHPDYPVFGLGTLTSTKGYTSALLLADRISVPSEALAASLRSSGYKVSIIPDGWNHNNNLWKKQSRERHTVNIGWIGDPGGVENVALVRQALLRVMSENPQSQLLVSGDPQVYQLFEALPDSRKHFLPKISADEYPNLFKLIDILIVPLRNIPFNQSLSDRRLMEAGISGIPWLASPTPSHTAWGVGGVFARSPNAWHEKLSQLVQDKGLRKSLGEEGRLAALEREMDYLVDSWVELILSERESRKYSQPAVEDQILPLGISELLVEEM